MLAREQGKVLRRRFAKADARVQHDAVCRYARIKQRLRRITQKVTHLRHSVARHRLRLHGLRFAVHVHQADTAARVRGDHGQRARLP